jgi:hypothetical protein
MHAASDTVASNRSHATLSFVPVRSPRSPRTSSLRAHSTAITAYTSGTVASFTTLASRMDCGADRWKTFHSLNSHEAATSEFDTTHPGSIVAKWWRVRVHVWANAVIDC